MKNDKPVLVTGATGYVGGRLIPALLDAGYRVSPHNLEKIADTAVQAAAVAVAVAAANNLSKKIYKYRVVQIVKNC